MKLKPIKIKKKKKAQSFFDIIVFMVMVFFMIVGFVVFKYVFHTASTNFIGIQMPSNSPVNMSSVAQQTFGNMDIGLGSLRYVSFAIIFGMIMNILLSNFLVKNHPAFFFLYLGITVLAVILSVFISNSAQGLMANPLFASTFTDSFPEGTFVLNYLPLWVTFIGFLGGIILYIGIIRDRETGGF
jgi:hypothetical protein